MTGYSIDEIETKAPLGLYKQKQELKDKGTDILGDLLGGNKKKDSTQTQTQTQQNTGEVVKDILGGLFGGKKKDTTNQGN